MIYNRLALVGTSIRNTCYFKNADKINRDPFYFLRLKVLLFCSFIHYYLIFNFYVVGILTVSPLGDSFFKDTHGFFYS